MKNITILLSIILFFVGRKPTQESIAIGTWYRCNKDGSYWEYEIKPNYMLMMTTKADMVWIFKNEIVNKTIILSSYENGPTTTIANQPLIPKAINKDKILLKHLYSGKEIELNRAKFEYEPIDSINLESWKHKTLTEFKKRAKQRNCKDVRIKSEKEIQPINLDSLLTEEPPIIIQIKKPDENDTIHD